MKQTLIYFRFLKLFFSYYIFCWKWSDADVLCMCLYVCLLTHSPGLLWGFMSIQVWLWQHKLDQNQKRCKLLFFSTEDKEQIILYGSLIRNKIFFDSSIKSSGLITHQVSPHAFGKKKQVRKKERERENPCGINGSPHSL